MACAPRPQARERAEQLSLAVPARRVCAPEVPGSITNFGSRRQVGMAEEETFHGSR